ncbi:MAG: hypothetical protein M1275_03415 [Patescibacteria group bacterium]|nr:hypothetical protein [Patescibacteria group bacterium]
MSYSNYVKKAESFIAGLTVPALYSGENIDRIKEYAYYLIESIDEPAGKFIASLQNLLDQSRPASDAEKTSYDIAYFWLVRLKTVFFSSLGNAGREKYLDRDFMFALQQGFDVWGGLDGFLSILPPEEAQKTARNFAGMLARSTANTGFGDTLGNWLARYRQRSGAKVSGGFAPSLVDVVTFINTDSTAKSLQEDVKDQLRNFLTIYSRLFSYQLAATPSTTVQIPKNPTPKTSAASPIVPDKPLGGVRSVVAAELPAARPVIFPRITSERVSARPVPPMPRIISQGPAAEPRAKMDLLKPEVAKRQPASIAPSAPERTVLLGRGQSSQPLLTPEEQKATLVSGSKLFNMSLSHALANADQGLTTTGNMRTGTETPQALPNEKSVAPKQAPPVSERATLSARGAPSAPLQANLPVPSQIRPESVMPSGVIDLSRRQVLDIASISAPEQLQKIGLADADGVYFAEKLSQIKQRISHLSDEHQLPVTKVAENFYRSPLYQLFMNMGVAVMNDNTSPDQKAAFEKVVGNYKAAHKEVLSREQFLALSSLKKEISELEVKI